MDPALRLARIPSRPPRVDFLIAGVLLFWGLLEALLNSGPGSRPARVVFAIAVTVPLVMRRRWPLSVVCFIAVVSVLRILTAERPEVGTLPFPSLIFMAFSVALYQRTRIGAAAGGLICWGVMALGVLSPKYNNTHPGVGDIVILTFFVTGAWGAGWLVRQRARQAQDAMAESGELARSAVTEERARIARELHDVVAHTVSIVAVQAGAAEQLLEIDPAAAREHLRAVRSTAREAMTEMRRLLDVLRADDAGYAPQPGLSRLDDLLEDTRAAGVPVELVQEGERTELAPGIDMVAFRILQEALTNVRKHAGAVPTRVGLRFSNRALEIEVRNDPPTAATSNGTGPADSGGHGIIGMRERAVLFGGSFDAGPTEGNGFRVHAVLPLHEAYA